MTKLFHKISAILHTGHKKRSGLSKMDSYRAKTFTHKCKTKFYHLMAHGSLLIKKGKFKKDKFID